MVSGTWILSKSSAARGGRGLNFDHNLHVIEQELDCIDCHRLYPEGDAMPTHALCGVCHEIEIDEPSASCARCHTRDDYTVDPLEKSFADEVIFSHDPHLAQAVDCTVCHSNPQKRRLVREPLMSFCIDCHEERAPEKTDCATCHRELRADTKPRFRAGARLIHDVEPAWQRAHGHEYQMDPQFCATCHTEQETFCVDCHRREPPDSHTVSWRRRTHGIHATWDRAQCAVCHEEDSCIKCHQNTEPRTHRRGGWGSPADRHCVSCHFPQQSNSCTVCHESIDHVRARPSPHSRGSFPINCSRCHPAGNPFRAPHPLNSSVRCAECHRN